MSGGDLARTVSRHGVHDMNIDIAIAERRPCGSLSSSGPITGASSANGAMVISR